MRSSPNGVDDATAGWRELLPASVVIRELRGEDCLRVYPLLPAEEAIVERAVERQQRVAATARYCAREALAHLGQPELPIVSDSKGAPLWPAGIVGSITHVTGKYCAAAVTDDPGIRSLGIDAEDHRPLPGGVLELASSDEERQALAALRTADGQVCWDTLLFSSKEAVYKAWYPLMRGWLGFQDVFVRIDPHSRRFRAELLGAPLILEGQVRRAMQGSYAVDAGVVLTAVVITAGG